MMIGRRAVAVWMLAPMALGGCMTGPMMLNPPTILAREPAYGTLAPGATVYVDDGQCPPGRIKRVTNPGGGVRYQLTCELRR